MGVYLNGSTIVIKDKNGQEIELIDKGQLMIPGEHNLENALAAAAICYYGGVDPQVISQVLKEFNGVEHRLEHITTKKGISFVNDSKGTNTDASIKAVGAIESGIFLIAGGYDKNSDFQDFIKSFNGKVKHLLLIGETANKIKETAEELGFTNITICETMAESVRTGYEYADEGDTVLLSPACASWDMYKNFEERGNHFRKVVEELD